MSQRHRVRVKQGQRRPFERLSPLEMHAKWSIGRPCDGCSSPLAIVKFTTYVLLADMTPDQRMKLAILYGDEAPIVQLKAGRAAMVGQQAACPRCRPALEKALARGPSYAFVDIYEAPPEIMKQAVTVGVL